MKLIPLTQNCRAMVDDQDYEELMQWKWHAHVKPGYGIYAKRNVPKGERTNRRTIGMHTHLTGYRITDHMDGDGLNNQRSNLREVDQSLNRLNTVKGTGGLSAFKGVYWFARLGKWGGRCPRHPEIDAAYEAKNVHLGVFLAEEDAARARDEATWIRFGRYATYNFYRPGCRSALTGEMWPE